MLCFSLLLRDDGVDTISLPTDVQFFFFFLLKCLGVCSTVEPCTPSSPPPGSCIHLSSATSTKSRACTATSYGSLLLMQRTTRAEQTNTPQIADQGASQQQGGKN